MTDKTIADLDNADAALSDILELEGSTDSHNSTLNQIQSTLLGINGNVSNKDLSNLIQAHFAKPDFSNLSFATAKMNLGFL